MAVVSVSNQSTRLDDAEATTDWGSDGGGAGGALETDFFYQNANCYARKGASGSRAIFLSDSTNTDLSGGGTYETVIFKYICTTPGLLDPLSTPGMRLEIGSGSTTTTISTNFYYYDVQGNDTYPIDKSWLILPINPNIASHRTGTTGTPDLVNTDCYALRYDQSGVSKSPNQGLDAVDIGNGLTLVGGDGASTDGVWQDFSDADWGTVANRYGFVRENEGVFLIYGMMTIGSATATVFNDSGQTVIFPDGLFAAGWSGITVDLQNATNDVDFVESTFLSQGTEAGEDTRPVLTVTSTSGAFDATDCTFDNFADLTLTSACTLTRCTVANSEGITQAGATLDSCTFRGATTADGVAFITATTLATISDCDFTFSDGHAIEITNTGTYSFAGNTFTGYGADGTNDAAIYNNSGGAVTINISGGGDTPTIRNGASASTTVNNTVNLNVHVEDASGTAIENAQVYVQKATPTAFTSGAGNTAGDGDLVVTQTIDSDMPGTGVCSVLDVSLNLTLPYRYASHDGANTFTFPTEVTGSATSTGSGTSLISTSTNFLTADIEEGDTIRNTTDGSYAVVDEIVDADNITTSALSGGTDNTWQASDAFSVHKLATTLVSGTDTVDVPLVNLQTDASGDTTKSYSFGTDTSVIIRVRSNNGATKYIPFNTSGTITSSGLNVTAVLSEDTEAT